MTNPNAMHRFLQRVFAIEPEEVRGLILAFLVSFTMFTAYTMLRPVRDAMGVTSGVRSLPALFWAVFAVTLLIQPLYGWLLTRFPRKRALPWVYVSVAVTLIIFYAWFYVQTDHTWIARAYFVWVSVFNLFMIAVFWSLMVDVFTKVQAVRLFGFLAAGLSVGGLTGPLLASQLAKPIGTINLLLIAAALLCVAAFFMWRVVKWSATFVTHAATDHAASNKDIDDKPLATSAVDGFRQVARSPYLIAISVFVLMLTFVSTILYIEQQRIVGDVIKGRDAQTAFFATLDFWVQAGALTMQLLLFPRLLRWLGFSTMLALVPAIMIAVFMLFAMSPTLAVVAGATIARRIGEFGITRPCREILFTIVPPEQKYLGKNLIDTFVYRGGDAISATIHAAVIALAAGTAFNAMAAGLFGVVIAVVWLVVALWLAQKFRRKDAESNPQPNI
jgi:ATP:ADP antiporter, AAA family